MSRKIILDCCMSEYDLVWVYSINGCQPQKWHIASFDQHPSNLRDILHRQPLSNDEAKLPLNELADFHSIRSRCCAFAIRYSWILTRRNNPTSWAVLASDQLARVPSSLPRNDPPKTWAKQRALDTTIPLFALRCERIGCLARSQNSRSPS
jgi:hypothetical protein